MATARWMVASSFQDVLIFELQVLVKSAKSQEPLASGWVPFYALPWRIFAFPYA
jgi:hypothetical protein